MKKSLFGLMAAFCLLALPSAAHSYRSEASFSASTITSAFHTTNDHAVTVNFAAVTQPVVDAGTPATAQDMVSSSSPATVEARNVLAHYSTTKHSAAALHRHLDGDRNRAGAELTYLVKERSRDLSLTANYIAPRRLRHQWRSTPDSRPPAKPLAS